MELLDQTREMVGSFLGRRERKKLEVGRRIREAALQLFHEKGYEATTVEEIAERADVAKGTFFNYFPRKDSLLEALAEDLAMQLLEELGPAEHWQGSVKEQLLRLYLRIGQMVARDPELSKVMIVENLRTLWLHTEMRPLEQEFRELVCGLLTRAAERGEIARDADVRIGGKLLDAAYVTTMIEWLKAGAPLDEYEQELTAKFDIIFRGLGTGGPAAKG